MPLFFVGKALRTKAEIGFLLSAFAKVSPQSLGNTVTYGSYLNLKQVQQPGWRLSLPLLSQHLVSSIGYLVDSFVCLVA